MFHVERLGAEKKRPDGRAFETASRTSRAGPMPMSDGRLRPVASSSYPSGTVVWQQRTFVLCGAPGVVPRGTSPGGGVPNGQRRTDQGKAVERAREVAGGIEGRRLGCSTWNISGPDPLRRLSDHQKRLRSDSTSGTSRSTASGGGTTGDRLGPLRNQNCCPPGRRASPKRRNCSASALTARIETTSTADSRAGRDRTCSKRAVSTDTWTAPDGAPLRAGTLTSSSSPRSS